MPFASYKHRMNNLFVPDWSVPAAAGAHWFCQKLVSWPAVPGLLV